MATPGGRRGLTLIDVLLVVAMLGMMLAIFLPALQQRRQAAQEVACSNKLKQLGIALLNHHDVYKRFPATSNQGNAGGVASVWWPAPGSAANTGAVRSLGYTKDAGTTAATAGYSWIVRILPYMDEAKLYNLISQASGKFTADAFTPCNIGGEVPFSRTFTREGIEHVVHFAATELDEVICPSYSGTGTVAPSKYAGTLTANPPANYGYPGGTAELGSPASLAAITNYVALSATHFPCMQYSPWDKVAVTTKIPDDADSPNGLIVPGTGLNLKTCEDGSSKTLMLCETIEPAMNCWYDGTTAWTTGINPNSIAAHAPTKDFPSGEDPNPRRRWSVPEGGSTALNVGPDPKAKVAYCPALEGYCAAPLVISWGASSQHPGGVVMHLAPDSSAHAISPDIDPTLYMHLITRAGREPDEIPADAN